ncbi:MAG TPA: hypothetical protein VJL39_03685 [Candidatus Paceibacterota bacterium]
MGFDSIDKLRRGVAKARSIDEATSRTVSRSEGALEVESLQSIFADEEKQALFGSLLKSRTPTVDFLNEIWRKRNAKEAWTPQELAFLQVERIEFADRLKLAEKARETFDPEFIEYMAETHGAFQLFAGFYTPDRAAELLHLQFGNLAMVRPDELRKSLKTFDEIKKKKESKEYKNNVKEFEAIRKRHDLSDEELADILKGSKTPTREKVTQNVLTERMGAFGKGIDWLSGYRVKLKLPDIRVTSGPVNPNANMFGRIADWVSTVQVDVRSTPDIKVSRGETFSQKQAHDIVAALSKNEKAKVRTEVEKHMKSIGSVFALATVKDDIFMKAVSDEVAGIAPVSRNRLEGGASSLQHFEQKKTALSNPAIQEYFRANRDAEAGTLYNKTWYGLQDDAQRDAVRDKIISRIETEHKVEGRGVIAQMVHALLQHILQKLRTDKRTLMPNDPRPPKDRNRNQGRNNQNRNQQRQNP